MSLEERYVEWSEAHTHHRRAQAHIVLCQARNSLSQNTAEDWQWLVSALDDAQRKWFVAWIFHRASLPKRLLHAMIRAAVQESNISSQKYFVEPCVATYGADKVYGLLSQYIQHGTEAEKQGAEKALYWYAYQDSHRGHTASTGAV